MKQSSIIQYIQEELIIKLVGAKTSEIYNDYEEVSVASPIGEAVFKHDVGSRANYTVNNNLFKVDILARSSILEDLSNDNQKKLGLKL